MRPAHSKFWTPEEDAILADLSLSAREVAEKLEYRTQNAVKGRRSLLKLSRIKQIMEYLNDK